MNSEYFKTRFRTDENQIHLLEEFVIITAYPTTGENWDTAIIDEADQKLTTELKSRKSWMFRIEGYSPQTRHAEQGWGTSMPIDEACDMGLRYLQDAIFYVKNDLLSVTYCDERRELVKIGSFEERLDDQNMISEYHD